MSSQAIPDDLFRKVMHVMVNIWFTKWRSRIPTMTDEDWNQCKAEITRIGEQGRDYPLVAEIGAALVGELDRRWMERNQ